MGMFDGLKGMGLGKFENLQMFDEAEKDLSAACPVAEKEPPKILEKDLIYDKGFVCPVCGSKITAKVMKTGKTKSLGTDWDLRAKYELIDPQKYEVILCHVCGYAALSRYFETVLSAQAKLIKEQISPLVMLKNYTDEVYGYEQAWERYQLALVNTVVKKAKNSEKAYTCLKAGWLIRGWREELDHTGKADPCRIQELKTLENQQLENALKGFWEARQKEAFPICGMDETTMDYLLAALSLHTKDYERAAGMVSKVLTSAKANARMKDKARMLKEQIVKEVKAGKE